MSYYMSGKIWIRYARKKIKGRATQLIPGLRNLRYEERLKECGQTTLEIRKGEVKNKFFRC